MPGPTDPLTCPGKARGSQALHGAGERRDCALGRAGAFLPPRGAEASSRPKRWRLSRCPVSGLVVVPQDPAGELGLSLPSARIVPQALGWAGLGWRPRPSEPETSAFPAQHDASLADTELPFLRCCERRDQAIPCLGPPFPPAARQRRPRACLRSGVSRPRADPGWALGMAWKPRGNPWEHRLPLPALVSCTGAGSLEHALLSPLGRASAPFCTGSAGRRPPLGRGGQMCDCRCPDGHVLAGLPTTPLSWSRRFLWQSLAHPVPPFLARAESPGPRRARGHASQQPGGQPLPHLCSRGPHSDPCEQQAAILLHCGGRRRAGGLARSNKRSCSCSGPWRPGGGAVLTAEPLRGIGAAAACRERSPVYGAAAALPVLSGAWIQGPSHESLSPGPGLETLGGRGGAGAACAPGSERVLQARSG